MFFGYAERDLNVRSLPDRGVTLDGVDQVVPGDEHFGLIVKVRFQVPFNGRNPFELQSVSAIGFPSLSG